MAIISNLITRFKSIHSEAYSMISDYRVDLINNRIKVNVITFASLEARLEEGDPIDSVTYSFEGAEYEEINSSLCEGEEPSPLKLEDTHKKNIYDKIMKKEKFSKSNAIREHLIKDVGDKVKGEEISMKEAQSGELVLGEDFEVIPD